MIWLGLVIALAALVWSGGMLATVLGRLARSLQVSSFLISFMLMAAATSVPELSVTIVSSLQHQGSLAFGTVVGSNIANIALVMGVLMLLSGRIKIRSAIRRREAAWAGGLALLPILLAMDGTLSRADGGALLLGFGAYVTQLLRNAHFFHKAEAVKGDPTFWRDLVLFALLVTLLLFSSRWVVHFAVDIAQLMGIPLFVIGLFVLAIGTSLPELVFAIRSSLAHDPLLSMGDITGSIVFNASVILGVGAMISPIKLQSPSHYLLSAGTLAVLLVYLWLATHTDKVTSRLWGGILLVVYAAFVALEWMRT